MLRIQFVVALLSLSWTYEALAQLLPSQYNAPKDYINFTRQASENVALQISTAQTDARNDTAPLLYGWMIEDISHSLSGGLYAELIVNRAFQGSGVVLGMEPDYPGTEIISSENPDVPFGPTLTGYGAIGDAQLSLDVLHPLSNALPTVMQLSIPANATGEVGFVNYGYWGMDVSPQTYNASFYMLSNGPMDATNLTHVYVSLRSNLTSDIWLTSSIPIQNLSDFSYTQFVSQLVNNITAPNSNNTFALTMNASEVAGSTFYLSLISLFPETYAGTPNGLRNDLGQNIKSLNPKFLRFPGGNNVEGYFIAQRFKWYETIGPLTDRPGRPGDWEYYNSDGFGLLEFLEWTEDMDLERVLAVYAGYSLSINGSEGASYPESALSEVLQSALDELEYCMGGTNTTYGALRAAHGHPQPFQINYVEIGNEDFFSSTYNYRFPYLYNGLKAAYPNITYISTAFDENADYNISLPAGSMWDYHTYSEPSFFLDSFNFFDNWQKETGNEDVTILVGEYSVFQVDTPTGVNNFSDPVGTHIFFPELLSAVAEAVYLIAMERNPNVVKMSSYAPSFGNFNWYNWTPNLISFDALPSNTVLSTSYYLQSLFAHYRGTQTLPTTNGEGDFNPLFWVATIDVPTNAVYVKVVNTGNTTAPLSIELDVPFMGMPNGTIITNLDVNGFNYRGNQTAITPQPIMLPGNTTVNDTMFVWDVPAFSISVLQFDV